MPDNALRRLAGMRSSRWLIDALEGVQESTGAGRPDPGWIHPTDLPHPCDAYWVFKLLGAPERRTTTARLQRIFDLGNARDEQLKKDAKKAGISLIRSKEDRKISIPELRIRGELDDVVQHPISREIFIVDYKTMNNDEWQRLEDVKPEHHIQVHPYMFAKQVFKSYVLYENKNTQEQKTKEANFAPDLWQAKITTRIYRVLDDIRNNILRRTPPPNDSQCPFYHMCSYANIEQLKAQSGLEF